MATEDDTILKEVEDQESKDPSLPIVDEKGPIFPSQPTMLELSGHPILADFGNMRLVEPMSTDWAMSDIYRAPEVLLKLPWAARVDIWSVGVMVRNSALNFGS
jgi:serine/threonine protein kinase